MARHEHEDARGPLAALQDLIAGGGGTILEQASSLRNDVQRRLADVGKGLEGQVTTVTKMLEGRLGQQIDQLVSSAAVSIRRDVDRVRERVRMLENRLGDGVRELLAPLQAVANGASERAIAALARTEELMNRVQVVERRTGELTRDSAREVLDADEIRHRLERIEQRLTEFGRELGGRLGEVGALKDRLTRLEGRMVETSKDQIARAGESAGLRDRLTRLESRLSELSKEQLARAVENAGMRERLLRLEQRGAGNAGASVEVTSIPNRPSQ